MSGYLKLEASRKNEQQEKELRDTAQAFLDQQKLDAGVYQVKMGDGTPIEFVATKERTLGDVKRFANRAERRKHYRDLRRRK